MRTNLKEAELVQGDELEIARGDLAAAEENKAGAEKALADVSALLEAIETKIKSAPRDALDTLLRDRLIGREKKEILEADVAEAEAVRIEVSGRVTSIRQERAKAEAEKARAALVGKIDEMDVAFVTALDAFGRAAQARADAENEAVKLNGTLAGYGLETIRVEATRSVLARLLEKAFGIKGAAAQPAVFVKG